MDYNELQPGSLTLLSMSNLTLLALLQCCVLCKLDFWGQIKHAKFDRMCAKRPVVGLNCGVLRPFGSCKTDIIFNSFIMNVLTCVHYVHSDTLSQTRGLIYCGACVKIVCIIVFNIVSC